MSWMPFFLIASSLFAEFTAKNELRRNPRDTIPGGVHLSRRWNDLAGPASVPHAPSLRYGRQRRGWGCIALNKEGQRFGIGDMAIFERVDFDVRTGQPNGIDGPPLWLNYSINKAFSV
jgi:hypothetical protein